MPEFVQEPLPELKPGFSGQKTPLPYSSNREGAEFQRAQEESQSFEEAMGLAVDNQWITKGAGRLIERSKNFESELGYQVTQDELAPFQQEFNAEDREYISKAASPEEFNFRVQSVREDIKRHQALSSYGLKGVGAELLAGILDPAGWAVGLFTGGAGAAAKGSRLLRTLKTAGSVAAEGAAFEAVMASSDTQRGLQDVLYAAGGSLVLGAGIGALARKAPETSGIASAADEFDKALKVEVGAIKQADEAVARSAAEGAPAKPGEPLAQLNDLDDILTFHPELGEVAPRVATETKVRLDAGAIHRTIEGHIKELQRAAKQGFTGRQGAKARATLAAKAKFLDDEIAEISDLWKHHYSRVAASLGAPRSLSERAALEYRMRGIDSIYEPKLKRLQEQLTEAESRLTAADNYKKSKAELEEFEGMSLAQKIRKLYPEGAPKLRVEVEKQVQAAKEVSAQIEKEVEEIASLTRETPEAPPEIAPQKAEAPAPEETPKEVFATGETLSEFVERLITAMAEKPKPVTLRYLPRPVADRIQSLFATLDHSENLAFRALAHSLLENPQGGVAPEDTAAILSAVYDKKFRSAVRNRYNEGYFEWSASQGRNPVAAALDMGNHRDLFNKEVFLSIQNPSRQAHPSVKKAADGLRDGFSEALATRKAAGEVGFENVKDTRTYMPIIFDGPKMLIARNSHSESKVLAALSKGYQTGKFKLTKKAADRLAKMQYIRSMDSNLSMKHSFENVISQAERERFLEELRAAGVDETAIQEFVQEKELKEMLDNVSNRAKRSMGINPEAEVDGLKVVDLLNYNAAELSENYFREAAGGAAMAQRGFGTYNQAMQVIDAAERYGLKLGHVPKRTNEEAGMLRDAVNMIYGKSVEADPRGGVEKGSRRLREYTGLIRLQMMGFAQFPEAARAITNLGLKSVMQSVPGVGIFRRRAVRVGERSSGMLKEPELREIEELLGYQGESNWLAPANVRHDDWGEGETAGKLARLYDNAMAHGTRINAIASGFQAVQGGLEKIVAKSIKKRLIEMAEGTRPMDKRTLSEIGWDDTFIEEFSRFIKDNPLHDEFNGRQVRLMNIDKMPPEMKQKVMIGMTRLSARLIQRNFVGETSPWMNKWLGKTLTQFKTFSIVSAEKQLIHDLKGDKIKAATILGWSSLLGYISYATQVHLLSIGEEDPEAFLDTRLDERNAAWGVFNKLPQTAIVSLGGDFLATLGALPDEMYSGPGRYGFRRMSAQNIAPGVGTVADTVDVVNSTMNLLSGDAEGRAVADKARKLIPLMNAIGTGQMVKASMNLLD